MPKPKNHFYLFILLLCFSSLGCFNNDSLADAIYGAQKQDINPPSDWGSAFLINQGVTMKGVQRTLYMSGQSSVVIDTTVEIGIAVRDPDDVAKQLFHALRNIDELLHLAKMERENIVQIRFYTTDMDAFKDNYKVYRDWIKKADIKPTQSVLGVQELALPGLVVEVEATAVQ